MSAVRAGDAAPCGPSLAPPLEPRAFARIRRRMALEGFKWDPHFEDHEVLSPRALVLDAATWRWLARACERLDAEALAAERMLLDRPDLVAELGLPGALVRPLTRLDATAGEAPAPRVARYDFHWTSEGWRLSESNCDVPGGHVEASTFAALVGAEAGLAPAGDPAGALAAALVERLARAEPGVVALVHATAYSDDRQVMELVASRLREAGAACELVAPDHVAWDARGASLRCSWTSGRVAAVVRFFPAEWLPALGGRCAWGGFLRSASVPLSNPATSILVQSKRFPLAWDDLGVALPAWREHLPETRDPSRAPWRRDRGEWVLKPALGRVGEGVAIDGVTAAKALASARRWAWLFPGAWAAQRRFESLPLEDGSHACVGVFVVDGRAAGAYGRVSARPLIDMRARDAAVLVAGGAARSQEADIA